jgi:SAM-dependent methyltransferase
MLKVAHHLVAVDNLTNIRLERWDVIEETAFPFPNKQFDLIISSVVIPYLDDPQTITLIEKLAFRLAPGGVLAFVEQDLMTDSVNFPNFELFRRIVSKDLRNLKRTLALGLRPLLRKAGLQVLPRRSFLWTDETYGSYMRDLLERFAKAACDRGQITLEEEEEWKKTLDELTRTGDFYYGLVYHLVAGRHE